MTDLESLRETTQQIIEKRGYVLYTDVSERLGISPCSAAQCLHHNYRKLDLRQIEDGKNLSERRWKYVRDSLGVRKYFKSKIPSCPDLSIFFSLPENKSLEASHEVNFLLPEHNVRTEYLEVRHNELRDETEMRSQRKLQVAEMRHKESLLKTQNLEETLTQKIDRILDELHAEGKVTLIKIRLRLKSELGNDPNVDTISEAIKRYNKSIKEGRYVWNSREGYSTSRKTI